jgi:glycerol uptake facilitator-like aquaporin
MPAPLRLLAEFLGTAVLVMAVVGSGLLGQALSADLGVVILINQLATVMILGVLVGLLMPVSGAHINPAVTLVMVIRREISLGLGVGYVLVQLAGGVFGTVVAHVMFERQVLEFSTNDRLSLGTFVGEVVATAGLLALILTAVYQQRSHLLPLLVPAWIGAAFFFTSSTSFANPAVALGRMFTDSFTGIAPGSVTGFIGAQVLGALLAIVLVLPFSQAHNKEVS